MANTFTRNRDSIITAALRKLGVIEQGDLPEPEQMAEGAEALEDLLKHLQASTELRWNLVTRTDLVLAETANLTLLNSTDVIDLYNLTLSDDDGTGKATGSTLPVKLVDSNFFSRNYSATNTISSRPTIALAQFDRPLDINTGEPVPTVSLQFYPPPPQNYVLTYQALVKQANAGVGTDTINVDEMWLRVLKYGLACDLADDYLVSLERSQRLEAKYASLLEEAQRKSRNTKDTFFIYPV